MEKISKTHINEFCENGYVIVKNLLDQTLLDKCFFSMNQILTQQLNRHYLLNNQQISLKNFHDNLITLYRFDQEIYLSTVRMFSKLKSVYDLFLSSNIESACLQLGIKMSFFHTPPVVHLMSHDLKINGGYFGISPHQDWHSIQTSLNTVIVWIPLFDVDKNLFPLEVFPGTHLRGLIPGKPNLNLYEIDENYFKDVNPVALEVNKRDAIFMSSFLIHQTGISSTDKLRLAASWRYEDALDRSYMERHFPFAQNRTFTRELITPDFPREETVHNLYTNHHSE